ncbi:MAG: heparan-alpha-glucosaminide N-acetyltransferase domain-containing protein [Poseidonia sp.]
MTASQRSVHIDALRGLAVLLMVLVHAAATWEPSLSGGLLALGVIVSAGGGLAAPLFVALLGWGLAQRALTPRQRWWRAGWLFACQGAVNLSAPHLFDPFTPGVLSLLGLLILTEPLWARPFHSKSQVVRSFAGAFVVVLMLSIFTEPWQGPSDWTSRVETPSFTTWTSHLITTGLYPLFPWVLFGCFGFTVARLSSEHRQVFFRNVAVAGLVASTIVLVQSQRVGQAWALPTGNAALTFFPANAPFLIAAMTGVAILWWIVERLGAAMAALSHVGRVSLTVYVLHFVPFALFHQAETIHGWSAFTTAGVVVAYTAGWIVLGTWLARRPHLTIESWMRREPS